MSENAKLILFSAIEGGSKFWFSELQRLGADELLRRIIDNVYSSQRKSADRIREKILSTTSETLAEEIERCGGRFITAESEEWPIALNDLAAPPIGLIIKGKSLRNNSVSIVGTRNPTTYGARIASEFAAGFADREWCVVSGGAYGIDTHAHRGAIAAEGITVAVLGSGVSVNYPAGNERLFSEITESGSLISEVMPFEKARPERFLTRNRIIAALTKGTIIVEAAFRSGSLRTARDAAEIYRTVMAVPGPITSPTSDGCHRLIGERCAEIVTSVSDAMELLMPLAPTIDSTLRGDES
ncbi:MAG: DNA-protecting protein DprA [Candidatus Nanopelagicaceae bacterium]|nr:DNA-protecting protein DprA [Candidatus Nanopelagicaceae bacterium]